MHIPCDQDDSVIKGSVDLMKRVSKTTGLAAQNLGQTPTDSAAAASSSTPAGSRYGQANRRVGSCDQFGTVVQENPGLHLPDLDLSKMSIGSGVIDKSTGAVSYPDVISGAKKRAPDGIYKLGLSIVSVMNPMSARVLSGKQRDAEIKKALAAQQNELWKPRKQSDAQMEAVTGQMEALSVRAEFKEAVLDRIAPRIARGLAAGESVTEASNQGEPLTSRRRKNKKKLGPVKAEDLRPSPPEPSPISMDMLQRLEALIHPPVQLRFYNYTLNKPTPKEVEHFLAKQKVDGDKKTCRRCEKPFLYEDIAPNRISRDKCVHHPGRCSIEVEGRKLKNGVQMKVWSCCNKRGFTPGCTTTITHVIDVNNINMLEHLCPFESTPPANAINGVSKIQKAIALDCEMSYTKYGLTLTRMSVLSFPDGTVLEDTYIREAYPGVHILDYNTRYSGVTCENLYPKAPENSLPVLEGIIAARRKLWEYCDANTIIIGHGLDNDLKCLRMLHPKVVDTALLFSKVKGQKFRLKKLAAEELNRSIQAEQDETGHDSTEDCRTCIELVLKYMAKPPIASESAASEIPD